MADRMVPVPDDAGQPIQPLGWQGSGIDFEVYRKPYGWEFDAYDEDVLVGNGKARTRRGLNRAMKRVRQEHADG